MKDFYSFSLHYVAVYALMMPDHMVLGDVVYGKQASLEVFFSVKTCTFHVMMHFLEYRKTG